MLIRTGKGMEGHQTVPALPLHFSQCFRVFSSMPSLSKPPDSPSQIRTPKPTQNQSPNTNPEKRPNPRISPKSLPGHSHPHQPKIHPNSARHKHVESASAPRSNSAASYDGLELPTFAQLHCAFGHILKLDIGNRHGLFNHTRPSPLAIAELSASRVERRFPLTRFN